MSTNTNSVRGTRDFLPKDMELREYVKNTILQVYKQHGFMQIQTPVLEDIDKLLGSEGGENLKLIFKILKRGDKLQLDQANLTENDVTDMGLRYDLTLPLSRFYANNHGTLPNPFKSIQIGEVFRAERPQKGRFRSFVQCDIDIMGDESYTAELDLIATTAKALQGLGFKGFTIRINDRRILKAIIEFAGFSSEDVPSVSIVLDKQDKVGLEGVKAELLEKGYGEERVSKLIDIISQLKDPDIENLQQYNISEDILIPLKRVVDTVSALSQGEYTIKLDTSLVRGMGYYTGMIFEIEYSDYGFSIAGGGRYDKMIGRFMKNDVPAVGFSIGFERIITILEEQGFTFPEQKDKVALLYDDEKDSLIDVMKKADELRKDGKIVSMILKHKKLGKQINRLQEQGFNSFGIFGDDFELKEL